MFETGNVMYGGNAEHDVVRVPWQLNVVQVRNPVLELAQTLSLRQSASFVDCAWSNIDALVDSGDRILGKTSLEFAMTASQRKNAPNLSAWPPAASTVSIKEVLETVSIWIAADECIQSSADLRVFCPVETLRRPPLRRGRTSPVAFDFLLRCSVGHRSPILIRHDAAGPGSLFRAQFTVRTVP
jgi:hypothetical protein